jgi:GNAT superfamily N-acetyltransferase
MTVQLTTQQQQLLKDCFDIVMDMHANTQYKNYPVNESDILQMIANHIIGGFVRLKDGCLFIGKTYTPWFGGCKFASDVLLYTKKESRGKGLAKEAVKEFIKWGKSNGAVSITIGQSTGVNEKEFNGLAEGLGMKRIGAVYNV